MSEVFSNLGETKANELYKGFRAKGMSEDDAFSEVYSIECNLDEEKAVPPWWMPPCSKAPPST